MTPRSGLILIEPIEVEAGGRRDEERSGRRAARAADYVAAARPPLSNETTATPLSLVLAATPVADLMSHTFFSNRHI